MKIISSKDNAELKWAKRLHEKKERDEAKLFFFEGIHLFEEYIKSGREPHTVFVTEAALEKYPHIQYLKDKEYARLITSELYRKITAEQAPQGIFTVSERLQGIDMLSTAEETEKYVSDMRSGALILETISDPGNLGTIIRTAVSLGLEYIVIGGNGADVYSPKTVRASMGAIFTGSFCVASDLDGFVAALKKRSYKVYAAVPTDTAVKIGKHVFSATDSFIIGNEGNGISDSLIAAADCGAYIPMSGKTESLNAAAAATIIIWEMTKNG